jgi:hypothetical protein
MNWMSVILVGCLILPMAELRAEEAIDIGSRRELLVDHFLIDRMSNASLRMHNPQDQGPVLKLDRPWEGIFSAYFTVIDAGEKFQLYYRGLAKASKDDDEQVTCYAESADGIKWTRPELEIHSVGGHKRTNIILGDAPGRVQHNFSPFLDTRPGVSADQRYKAMGGYHDTGLYAYVSPDGINWRPLRDGPVLTQEQAWRSFAFDSQNVSFWSEAEQKYLLYFRIYHDRKRRVARMESNDFITWSNPQMMEYERNGDAVPVEELYTSQTHPYFRAPHLYVATAARFMLGRRVLTDEQAAAINVHPKYFHDTSDAVLLTSRGGNTYQRTFMSAFVAPGIGAENWVSRTNYPALNVVKTGPHEMSVYVNQNYGQPTAHLRRYSLRLDGFASVRVEHDGGEMITRPLTFDGAKLYLNFSTSAAGGIRVEIQDAEGKAIPGFALEDCRELIGNEIERAIIWSGGDLSKVAGKTVRLRFVMNDADLYAIRFGND